MREFIKCFGKVEGCQLLSIVTIIDTQFKSLHFKDPDACNWAINLIGPPTQKRW
jgi:hypothetical protein